MLVPRGLFDIGLGMCIPTICTWGTQAQRDRFARKALRGEEIWCQLFSEPAAGSDLAGLRTRAERAGDDWIINGQKIWTSGAHYCDYGVLVTRSDSSAKKHKGLTYFFIDMTSPGIEIRPIKQISGASHFNEVFFKDVRVPDSQRLGAVGEGWQVALTTLMNERYTIGSRSSASAWRTSLSWPASSISMTGRRCETRLCATSWQTGTSPARGSSMQISVP